MAPTERQGPLLTLMRQLLVPASSGDYLGVVVLNPDGTTLTVTGGGGVSQIDGSAFTLALSLFNPIGGLRDDAGTALADGKAGIARLTSKRALHATLHSAAGAEITTWPVTNAGTFAVQAAQSGTWNVGTVATITNVVHVDDNAGSLTVDGTVAATQSGTWNVGTVTAVTDITNAVKAVGNVAHDGVGTGQAPLLVGGYASAAAPTDVSADGDAVRAWYLRSGALATVITAAGALIGGDVSNGLDVDVTRVSGNVTVINAGTFAVQAAQSGTWNVGTVTTVTTVSTVTAVTDITNAIKAVGNVAHDGVGTGQAPLLIGGYASAAAPSDVSADGDATRLWVLRNGAQAMVITAAGALIAGDVSNGLDVDVTRVTGNVTVTGTVAHDGVDSGNPQKIGFRAETTEVAAVADADRVDGIADTVGRQLVLPYAVLAQAISGATSDITGTTSTSVIAGSGSNFFYITQLTVMNSHATVGTWVNIQDGSGGTTLYTVNAQPLGGGVSISFPFPLRVPTAGNGLFAACVTTGSNVRVSAAGFKSLV